MMNKSRAKLKNGGARKMKMGGDYMETSKEVKFGGPSKPMKYTQGGKKKEGDKTYTKAVALPEGATSNYKGEVFDKDGNKIGKRVASSTPKYLPNEKNAGSISKASVDYINRSRGRTKTQTAKNKSNAEMAKEADKRMTKLKNKAATTSGIKNVGRPTQQGGNKNRTKPDVANFPAFGPASKDQRAATKTSTPKPARSTAIKKKSADSVSQNIPEATLQKSTTKNVAADLPKSKKASRVDRRTERVTNRKASRAKSAEANAANKAEAAANRKKEAASRPTKMDRKAARMNKRADRVEVRKEKKADVNAAKARLKAARRLQSGGMKTPTEDQKGLKKLPTSVRNKMGYKKYGGKK